ncbi:MAG: DNA polymerase III subunit gamma/tau [Eubacterium sp.]|nr:DNA polymerase III subunit gamma/tau [Eubacterium sp.]MDD7208956.1 DNA polymerase III subunit gamma/tau [Lachnospiraceae bacterium]MDY5496605.1 DNA polymerase III subunit gamma/tau [Anaerobutyricum sp.]
MGYMALYRKWRPQNFDEVQGQDAIVRTLRNQIIYNRIGHAYLFCGTRGTGKTSIAKLFAKAVNCEHPVNGNPCNACPSCQAINRQVSLDVLEIDAASNNGVDNIRDIREQVQYSPVEGRYKVYIIDEVHMLSPGAFNALLKTLEEPPAYVIFLLATTEKHKIPVTILSRCQKYDFKRISADTITQHLSNLMEKENVSVETKALRYIARAADGSMRDALSLLDQCISFYIGQTLTYENVLDVLGTADTSVFSSLLRQILAHNTMAVLDIIDNIINEGRELSQFLSDFLWYLRNLLILKDQEGAEDCLDLSRETINAMREESDMINMNTLLRLIRLLSDLSGQLRTATQKRVLLEVGFIKLCRPETETDTESLAERIRQLEEQVAHGILTMPSDSAKTALPKSPVENTPGGTINPSDPASVEEALEKRFSPAQAKDLMEIASQWDDMIGRISMPMQKFLRAADLFVTDNSSLLQLVFHDELAKNYFECNHHHNLDLLSEFVAEQTGKAVVFECISEPSRPSERSDSIDLSKIHQTVIFE